MGGGGWGWRAMNILEDWEENGELAEISEFPLPMIPPRPVFFSRSAFLSLLKPLRSTELSCSALCCWLSLSLFAFVWLTYFLSLGLPKLF